MGYSLFTLSSCRDAPQSPWMAAGGGNSKAEQPQTTGSLLSTFATCRFLSQQICRALLSPRVTSTLQNSRWHPQHSGANREALLNSTGATGSLTLCADTSTGTGSGIGTGTAPSKATLQQHTELSWGWGVKCKAACRSYKYFSGEHVHAQHLQVAAVAGMGPGEEVGRLSPTLSSACGWFLLHRASETCTCGQVMCVQHPCSLGRCRVSHSCILQGCPEAVEMGTALPRVPRRK